MTEDLKIVVGGSAREDAEAFVEAWERAERDEPVQERVLSFESWSGLAAVMTGERFRMLRHLHATPAVSVGALAQALGRHDGRVQADVAALEIAGLVEQKDGVVRTTADGIRAEIHL